MNPVPAAASRSLFLADLARHALLEDRAGYDVTTMAVLQPDLAGSACIRTREPVVSSGVDMAMEVFLAADSHLQVHAEAGEGTRVAAGETILMVEGSSASILSAERTALNFLQHLCGIATLARQAMQAVAGSPVQLLATRKTLPGLRNLQRRAAEAGGFAPHRTSLADGILIKDNHIALCGSAAQAVTRARSQAPSHLLIEVEIEAPDQLEAVITAGAQIVLLDNFTPEQVAQVVTATRQRVLLEASGGITMETLPLYAATGVDRISVGFVTHSAPAVDLFMDLTPAKTRHDA
ncbi:MAG: carboxylating nicotinate-nucleotide diphosphorylase [Acidobacteria bacterium]|nr:MAG: carboxylating nicotinate-nucleotide diphosphorylase [Acidobacteriota bacterium]